MEVKINPYGLIVLIGGLLALVSLFLAWATIPLFGGISASITGFDILKDAGGIDTFYMIMILVMALVAIVFVLLRLMGTEIIPGNIQKILILVFGVLIILFSVLEMWDVFGEDWIKMGIGFYLAVVGGALILIASLLSMLNVLPDE